MLRRLLDWTISLARSPRATFALGVISFVESSFFPIPADVLFVPMCAARPERAWRLALVASVTSVLGGIFGWIIGFYAFEWLARPILEFYGKLGAFETLRAEVAGSSWIILLLLVTSGLAHLPPMKVVTILSGLVGFNLPLFVVSAIVARSARFYGLAWIIRRYGASIIAFIEKRALLVISAILVAALAVFVVMRLA